MCTRAYVHTHTRVCVCACARARVGVYEPLGGRCTALQLAVLNGHLEIADLLIKRKAAVDHVDHHKYTALHYAVTRGDAKSIGLLCENDALVDFPDGTGGSRPQLSICL